MVHSEIEDSRASSTVVGNWAASVHQWMTLTHSNDEDQMEDEDERANGDIVSRAKGNVVCLIPTLTLTNILFYSSGFSRRHLGGARQNYS